MPSLPLRVESPFLRVGVLAARVVVGSVFLWAALPKLADPAAFAEAISNYRVIEGTPVVLGAVVLPGIELAVSAALFSGIAGRGAAAVAVGLLAAFSFAIVQAIVRQINIDCGCFGAGTEVQADWLAVARNAGLVLLALLIMISERVSWRSVSNLTPP